jgi:pimeloyl-ACP methyl ester carboxylesterase
MRGHVREIDLALSAGRTPVLYLQGGQDRIVPSSHAGWLAGHTPSAELWLRPDDGHVSVLGAAETAMGWLMEQAR